MAPENSDLAFSRDYLDFTKISISSYAIRVWLEDCGRKLKRDYNF